MVDLVCLQGGGEFAAACEPMDAELVRRAVGRVVIAPFACASGREYDLAAANGVRHHERVGGTDVAVAPDPDADPAGALAAVREARLLVLPGGSPARLLARLAGELAEAVRAVPVLSGSSAGAMVLGEVPFLPEHGRVARGLAVVPGVAVVPHFSGTSPWLPRLAAAGVRVLGVPESSGVLVEGDQWRSVGAASSTLHESGRSTEVPR